jgi:hypothetical protein
METKHASRSGLTSDCYCRGELFGSTALALQLALWPDARVAQ